MIALRGQEGRGGMIRRFGVHRKIFRGVGVRCASTQSDTPFEAPGLGKMMRKRIEESPELQGVLGSEGKDPELSGLFYYLDTPASYVQDGLNFIHISTGLPWWLTIASSTVLLRLSLFPFAIYSNHNMLNYSRIASEINYLHSLMKVSTMNLPLTDVKGRWEKYMLYRKGKQIIHRNNSASPYKNAIAPLIHVPLWITFSWGVRGLLEAKYTGCVSGGGLWFSDLTIPDATLVLPILGVASSYTGMHVLFNRKNSQQSLWWTKYLCDGLQMSLICMTPMLARFESGIFMYWITNALFGAAQTLLFQNDTFRVVIGLRPITLPETNAQLSKINAEKMEQDRQQIADVRAASTLLDSNPIPLGISVPSEMTPLNNRSIDIDKVTSSLTPVKLPLHNVESEAELKNRILQSTTVVADKKE